jgi:hypothetical protein
MQVSSNGSSPPWRKRRWLPFIMGTKVHYHYVWLKGLSKDLMMFEAQSANQMYHWSRTICSYKTDIEESWVPSCPILVCVGEKTQWVILCQFHPTGWETLLYCPWISKISLPTQKMGTLCIWLLCMRSEKTTWQTLEGETKVTQWTCSLVQS